MNDLKQLFKELDKVSNFYINKNPQKFLDIAAKIISYNEGESIPILLKYFDNNRDYTWVFESLMLSMEQYPVDMHIHYLLKNLDTLKEKTQFWTYSIFNRILNDDSSLKFFIEKAPMASKESLAKLLELIEREAPHHTKLVSDLRTKLKSYL